MNSVVLIGRLTADPVLKYGTNAKNTPYTMFNLAVDRNLAKDKKAEMQQKGIATADFPRIKVLGKQAENCAQFLAKGRLVAINGSIATGSYKANTGETKFTVDVLASRVEFLEWGDKKQDSGSSDSFNYGIDPAEFQAIEDDDDIPF